MEAGPTPQRSLARAAGLGARAAAAASLIAAAVALALRPARRPRPRRAHRAPGRGARRRAHRAASRARSSCTVRNDGPDPVEIAQVSVNDAFVPFTRRPASDRPARRADPDDRLPVDRGRGLRDLPADLDRRHGRAPRSTSPPRPPKPTLGFFGLMALLGIYVGVIPVSIGMLWLPFVRRVGSRCAARADGVHDRPARLPRRRRRARGPRDRRPRDRRRSAAAQLVFAGAAARLSRPGGGRLPHARPPRARRATPAPAAATWPCWSRPGSACTTSARAWRSAPPTRPARWRSAPSSSSASRSTTRPRAWRSSRRSPTSAPSLRRLLLLGLLAGAPGDPRRLDRRRRVQRQRRRPAARRRRRRDPQVIVQIAPRSATARAAT